MNRQLNRFLLLPLLLLVVSSCNGGNVTDSTSKTDSTMPNESSIVDSTISDSSQIISSSDEIEEMKRQYEHVIIIGVDGAGNNYQYANVPTIKSIYNAGAQTNYMRTSTPSMSAPCWTSLLHGVVPAKHKLTNDIAETKAYNNPDYPSIFQIAHEQDPTLKLASFCNWEAINKGIIEDGIDVYKYRRDNDDAVVEHLNEYLAEEKPNLVFVCLDNVDHTGHNYGWGPTSPSYMNALEKVDEYFDSILTTLEENDMIQNTLLLLTADHGGLNFTHGGTTDTEKYVFFGAWGHSVEKGTIGQMEIRDVPAIVSHALGLTPHNNWTSRIPNNLFKGISNQPRPLGQELVVKENLINDLPDSVISYFDFENDYTDVKKRISSSYSLFEEDSYKVAGHSGYGFNAYNGYMKFDDLEFGLDDFSLGMYVELAEERTDPVLFCNKNWVTGLNAGIVIAARGPQKDIRFNISNGAQRFDYDLPNPEGLFTGWTHFLFSFDRTNNLIRIFVNFEQVASFALPEFLRNYAFDTPYPYFIGMDITETFGYNLPAIIDDFAIFNKALDEDDVNSLKEIYL